jgi:hypothetical protein
MLCHDYLILNNYWFVCCCIQAGQTIFSLRNTTHSIFNSRQLDMHGLHAAEVTECLFALLPDIYSHAAGIRGHTAKNTIGSSSYGEDVNLFGSRRGREASTVEVTVITGSGHHTTGNKGAENLSRTYHAAVGVCTAMELSHRDVKDPRGYVGGIVIRLTEHCVDRYE